MGKFNEDRDWTYSQGCGCQVTFFHESGFHTSRMLPDPECTLHTKKHQIEARDEFMRWAKDELRFARDCEDA